MSHSVPTDDHLIALARRRDAAACEALMRRHNRRLFRVLRAVLGDDAEAEVALQETYIRALGALNRFAGDSDLETWLVAIALNEGRGRLRRRRDLASLADMVGRIIVGQPAGPGTRSFDWFLPDHPDWQPVPEAAQRAFPPIARIMADRLVRRG